MVRACTCTCAYTGYLLNVLAAQPAGWAIFFVPRRSPLAPWADSVATCQRAPEIFFKISGANVEFDWL